MSISLKRILHNKFPELWAKLERGGVQTATDFFAASELELISTCDIFPWELAILIEQIGSRVCHPPRTAFQLWDDLKSGPRAIQLFDGVAKSFEFPPGSVVELVGPAGSAKTQCCLQLAARVALPIELRGFGQGVWYIDTEKAFSAQRFQEIAAHRSDSSASNSAIKESLSRVFVHQLSELEQVAKLLDECEEKLIEQRVFLIVIDSIAAPAWKQMIANATARKDYDYQQRSDMHSRQVVLSKISAQLKLLAQRLNICCLIVNQVTTSISVQPSGVASVNAISRLNDDSSTLTAALGITWAHAMNIRFLLQSVGDGKRMTIVKSPHAANSSLNFRVSASGVDAQ